jgi:hypothetical protein
MSPRRAFICNATLEKVAARAWDASMQASNHDPEHAKTLVYLNNLIYAEVKLQDRRFSDLCSRLTKLETKLEKVLAGSDCKKRRKRR